MVGNIYENIGLSHARASIVDTRGIDDHNGLSTNVGLDNTDLAGARLEALADLLLL